MTTVRIRKHPACTFGALLYYAVRGARVAWNVVRGTVNVGCRGVERGAWNGERRALSVGDGLAA